LILGVRLCFLPPLFPSCLPHIQFSCTSCCAHWGWALAGPWLHLFGHVSWKACARPHRADDQKHQDDSILGCRFAALLLIRLCPSVRGRHPLQPPSKSDDPPELDQKAKSTGGRRAPSEPWLLADSCDIVVICAIHIVYSEWLGR
jgi:hypothetical protein